MLRGAPAAQANPQGLTVRSGSATAIANGPQLNITASQNSFLNWQSFNIAPGETTTFHQPSATSVVWNKINDPNPSQIWGHLNANGVVVLMNPAGFFFGPDAVVKAAGLVATTAPLSPDFGGGGTWQFNGPPPTASIVNYGQIKMKSGGSAFLIAENVENHGAINAAEGNVGLVAGQEVLISDRPDGRGLSVKVKLPAGVVDNQGRLVVDGGAITLNARVVNQDGLVQANSVRQHHGIVELTAVDTVRLGADSVIDARGDDSGLSDGGQVTIKSTGAFTDTASSRISVAGGKSGGDGGMVELSAAAMPAIATAVDGHAQTGSRGGRLVLDPTDIVIGNAGAGSAGSGTVNANSSPGTLNLNVNSAFTGFSQIDLQATHNLTVAAGTSWDLAQSTGTTGPGSQLTLEAGNDLMLQNNSSLVAEPGWSVTLQAGRDFATPNTVKPGIGGIYFQGNASLQTQDGSIHLQAGKEVVVNSGSVRTMAGGSIQVAAVSGSVNTGTKVNGFQFLPSGAGYVVDPDLGGISTAAGGDVSITAGQDITSYLPINGSAATDGGSGAFGTAPGNVTLTAGGNVTGHYVVRNGTGAINAGQNAGTSSRQLALSLVTGGWTVDAGQDILLQEVRNPNGIFNARGFSSSTTKHSFDYSPDAYVKLNAADSVQLLGAVLPRNSGTFEQNLPSIYPPSLSITAGAGGVEVANDVTLFPAPLGQLNITTSAGGSLTGTKPGDLAQLIMSDSAKSQYSAVADFGASDHAPTPLHLNDPQPVNLNIAGDLTGLLLVSPKSANINVGGNMVNSRFEVQNLRASDVTQVSVAGDILNRNEFTSVPLDQPPDLTVFDRAFELSPDLAGLAGKLRYNAQTHTLTFQGRMTTEELQGLLSLQVEQLDSAGNPLLDPLGNPLLQTVSVLDAATAQALFNQSQDVPLNPNTGYVIAGPGALKVNAHNLDLGATLGIQSVGPAYNPALAHLEPAGASINVNLSGNLDMFSTTISSLAGGDIQVNAQGNVNVGSAGFVGNDQYARGIFTVAKSDVTVIAKGDINVNGSRIAAYDGGNVTVKSLEGNVDAGTGGNGSVSVEKIFVDPATGEVKSYTPTIPGSGILATTFPPSLDPSVPDSPNTVGNILVETPRGNITASAGGIVQLALNGVSSGSPSVTLVAGSKDDQGHVLYPGSIDASGSGVIGANVDLQATAGVKGLVFAQQNISIAAQQSVNVTALAQGNVSVQAGGTVSGTVIGVSSVSVGGSSISAALLSQNVNASGSVGSAQVGFAQVNVAAATTQSAVNSDEPARKAALGDTTSQDDDQKKKQLADGGKIRLLRTVGRVTVILPKEQN